MKITRRSLLLAAAAAPIVGAAPRASAQGAWVPTREVEFVVPFATGGGADLLARVIHKIFVEESSCRFPSRSTIVRVAAVPPVSAT